MKKERKYETVEMTNMCAVINHQTQQVVVQDRIQSWKGIAFPGGHVEPAESIVMSTIREIKEETGLTIKNLKLCGIKDWYEEELQRRYIVFLFSTQQFEGTLLDATSEGKVFWQDINTLKDCHLANGFLDMANMMLYHTHTEFYYEIEGNQWHQKLL